jgi:hypothetical protein
MTRYLIVAHDAGGAEVVSSWVLRHPEHHYDLLLDGPAVKIFERKLSNVTVRGLAEMTDLLDSADAVLTGTGWASRLEKDAIRAARDCGVPVFSYLDHWTSYPDRFLVDGELVLPDEVWVGDEHALTMAARTLPGAVVRLEPNQYFVDLRDEITHSTSGAAKRQASGWRILYICEPFSEHSMKEYGYPHFWGYTEFTALAHFMELLLRAVPPEQIEEIRLRPHPAEDPDKYDGLHRSYQGIPIRVSQGQSLVQDVVWADWVVGCESMALVVGVLAGKVVLSCIPPGGRPCPLPHPEILSATAFLAGREWPVAPPSVPAPRSPSGYRVDEPGPDLQSI